MPIKKSIVKYCQLKQRNHKNKKKLKNEFSHVHLNDPDMSRWKFHQLSSEKKEKIKNDRRARKTNEKFVKSEGWRLECQLLHEFSRWLQNCCLHFARFDKRERFSSWLVARRIIVDDLLHNRFASWQLIHHHSLMNVNKVGFCRQRKYKTPDMIQPWKASTGCVCVKFHCQVLEWDSKWWRCHASECVKLNGRLVCGY